MSAPDDAVAAAPSPWWMDELGLSVRTQNVLSGHDWVTVDVVRALDDRTILRAKDAGRRVLDELRARGLRPDSCTVAGCERHLGHDGEHVQYASTYARRMERLRAMERPPAVIAADRHQAVAYLLVSQGLAVAGEPMADAVVRLIAERGRLYALLAQWQAEGESISVLQEARALLEAERARRGAR